MSKQCTTPYLLTPLNFFFPMMVGTILLLLFAAFTSLAQEESKANEEAVRLYQLGRYSEGLPFAQQAFDMAGKTGKHGLEYTNSAEHLALYFSHLGRTKEAETLVLQTLPWIEKRVGKEHLDYTKALHSLATFYLQEEDFDPAELYLMQALALLRSIMAKKDAYAQENDSMTLYHYCDVSNTLALVYKTIGQYDKATLLYKEVISSFQKRLGVYAEDIPLYAITLHNLATLYENRLAYAQAEPLFLQLLPIQEKIAGKTSISYRITQNNLASLYSHSQRIEKAEQLWTELLDTLEREKEKKALYVTVLLNLANLYFELERYEKSEQLGLKAKDWQERHVGKNNSVYQTIVFNLASTYQYMNRWEDANLYYKEAITKTFSDIEKNFSYLSEDGKHSFYLANKVYLDEYSLFAFQKSGALPVPIFPKEQLSKESLGDLYNVQLATKGLILSATTKMRKRLLASGDSVLIAQYHHWEKLKEQIAQLNSLTKEDQDLQPASFDSLVGLANHLEQELVRSSSTFKMGFESKKISWEEVQKKLKPGEAAIELVRLYNGILYVALILTPETKKYPEVALIKSGKTMDLEKHYLANYRNCIRLQTEDTISYRRFWKPVYEKLQQCSKVKLKKVFFSSEGIFNQININTLQNPETGKYVLDELDLHLVTNTKELLLNKKHPSRKLPRALLFGRPTYGTEADSSQSGSRDKARAGAKGHFLDLLGTENEVKKIDSLLKTKKWATKVFLGKDASEENVKKFGNPTLLHIATHGFFLTSSVKDKTDPTLQAGLVLAGANNPGQKNQEDGLLTAYEAMGLDLDSTQLVVLSACETGLGEVETGEGVYGLQRTLKVAGAQSILMSLWKVDDQATQELMTLFYKNWLSTGNKRDAFRKAQMAIRKNYPSPYYWGAFVIAGK